MHRRFAAAVLLGTACGAEGDPQSVKSGEATSAGAAPGTTTQAKEAGVKAERLEHDGVSIELPNKWEGRILALDYPAAVLQAANFKFAVGTELPPGEEDPIKAMTAEHALVSVLPCGIVSSEEPARPAPEQVALDKLTFLPTQHPRVPRGHAFAHASFDFDDRCLLIEVDFGATPPSPRLARMVNEVLASLSVAEK